jgi:hypothetical protein
VTTQPYSPQHRHSLRASPHPNPGPGQAAPTPHGRTAPDPTRSARPNHRDGQLLGRSLPGRSFAVAAYPVAVSEPPLITRPSPTKRSAVVAAGATGTISLRVTDSDSQESLGAGHSNSASSDDASLLVVCHERPPGRPARARPPGRAQHAGPARRAREQDDRLSHVRAAGGGVLDPRRETPHSPRLHRHTARLRRTLLPVV